MELPDLFVEVFGTDPLVLGLVAGVFIAACNTAGALLVLIFPDPSDRTLDAALGFAAGVMLSASFTSLLLPGIEYGDANPTVVGDVALGGLVTVIVGFVAGVVLLDRSDAWVPGVERVITGRHPAGNAREVSAVVLFVVAITLHNAPEGLAVGVGFGAGATGEGSMGNAIALMLAIGAQNIPEGLAVSIAALNAGLGRMFYAVIAGVRAGLVEIPLAVFGAVAVAIAAPLLPYAMGFAAGGMLFVISHEIIPQTHSRGHEHVATVGLLAGLVVMLVLDVSLG